MLSRPIRDLSTRYGIPTVYFQFFLYAAVGGLCSIVDVGGFWILQGFEMPLIPASGTSFTVATLLNYILSSMFVFTRGRHSRNQEVLLVFGVSLVGLGLNSLLVYLFVRLFFVAGVWAKISAIPFVLFWNFFGRRVLVFYADLPLNPAAKPKKSVSRW